MRDPFILVTKRRTGGYNYPGIVRVTPSTYDKLVILKEESGLSFGKIIEQCVEYALDHMEERTDAEE